MSNDVTKSYAVDQESSTWRAVQAHIASRIDYHRRNLEAIGNDPQDYDVARGALQELRLLLDLPDEGARRLSIAANVG